MRLRPAGLLPLPLPLPLPLTTLPARLLPPLPPQAVAGLDLTRLQAALLLDSAPSAASAGREQRQEGRTPAGLLPLQEPVAAAALMLLRGAGLVSVNTCASSGWTASRRLAALLEGLAKGAGADVVRAMWAANGQVAPELACGKRAQVVYGLPFMPSVTGGRGRNRPPLPKKK